MKTADRVAQLEEALRLLDPRNASELFERIASDFHSATGFIAPGKDPGIAMQQSFQDQERAHREWRPFVNQWHERFFDALALPTPAARGES